MVRKHIKIEVGITIDEKQRTVISENQVDRWYYWADRLGLLVWQVLSSMMPCIYYQYSKSVENPCVQDFPCISDRQTEKLQEEWRAQVKTQTALCQKTFTQEHFMIASSRWMSQLDCHPSIIIWVVFNEAWGQFLTKEVGISVPGRSSPICPILQSILVS